MADPDMSDRIAAFDWSATPLGPVAGWPQSLQTAVRIVLGSRFSMWMAWGPELTFFYNDAYAADTLASKHPWALGKRADQVWGEIWDDIGPRIDQVLAAGTATWDEGLRLFLERSGYREETYHTFSYSPLRDEHGATAGMLCVVVEETDRVLGERRLGTLRELAEATGTAEGERALFAAIDRTLAANRHDLPFAFAYTTGEDGTLEAATAGAPGWPDRALLTDGPVVVDLAGRDGVPAGAWDEPPRQALAIPLADQGRSEPAGLLVAGLNPFRALDHEYRGFVELVAGQIAASLASVRAREAERERAEALAELDRAKTDFFSNVSHEFRTPLSLILGPAEDALADAGADADQAERLGVVFRNALRLQKLVNNLLEFSRIEAGSAEPVREPTDLAAFTTDLASMFRAATDRAGIALVVERPDGPVVARVDREMWERIVLNLVSNAFKFTFEGEIRVTLRRDGADAVLSVADTGTGIAADDLASLFERFRRVRGARSRTHEGSGIGLALVQELTRLHGGSVAATSEPGAGSTFTVRVPLEEAGAPTAAATPTSEAAAYLEEALRWLPDAGESVGEHDAVGTGLPSGAPEAERARILIADDNADLRDYLERLLARHWDVETVRDGRAALEAVRERRPDLILSDAMMPEVDGFALLAQLRSDPATSQLPVIMLSARAGDEAAVEGLAAGADDYLVKPFSSRELIARVRANLDLADMRQAAARATERHARLLRDLADAAVDVNRAGTVPEVLEVVAERARALVGAERAVACLDGAGPPPGEKPFARRVALTGAGGRLLGELLLDGGEETGGVEAAAVLTQLAQVAATRLENALLYEREHRVAETLQRSLLPESVPQFDRAELAALYLPGSSEASVGGDWYDALGLDETTIGLVIGDVVGRGVRAASAMGQLRNAVRAYLLEGYGPAQTLARVNRLLETLGGGFATLACLTVDTQTGALRYANAGHPPPLVVAPDGATRWLEDGLAPPIGAASDLVYREAEDAIPDGGALVLYTDGLVERRGETIDNGLGRLAQAAADSPAHAATLARRLVAAMPASTARPDDVAVMALSRREAAGEPLVVRLPAEATSLGPLRERLRRWLAAEGLSRTDAGDVLLAVGEAASNAIEHPLEPSPAAVLVSLKNVADGETRIEIRDHGRWDAEPSEPHRGRGMQIMQAIAAGEVGIDRGEQGTTVTIRHRRGERTA